MGNSGGMAVPTQPPPNPAPIEDDLATKHQAAQLVADKSAGASRTANDLDGNEADKEPAITRGQLAKADTFSPQPRPRGPVGKSPRGPRVAPGSAGGIATSAVITG